MLRALCATLLSAVLAAAQFGEEQTLRVNVDLVNIYFTVCNHKRKLIPNLGRESFAVFEDDQLQTVTHFSREPDVPLTMVLVIDTSGSVRYKMRFEQDAAAAFVSATLRDKSDKAALVTFNHTLDVQQDYTNDPFLLAASLRHIIAGGGTRLYDALYWIMENKLNGVEERKAIVVITDGDDKSSTHSPEEIIDRAHRNNVSVYAISTNGLGMKPSAWEHSDQILEQLGSETGGNSLFPTNDKNLASSFERIATELRSQYTIAYLPSNAKRDGTFRRIRIETKKNRYSVRSRSGYYAPTQAMVQKN